MINSSKISDVSVRIERKDHLSAFIGVLIFSIVLLLSYFLLTTLTSIDLTVIVILSILLAVGFELLFHRLMNKKS